MTLDPISMTVSKASCSGRKAKIKLANAPVGVLELEHVSGDTWDTNVAMFDGVCQEQLCAFAQNRWPGVACEPVLLRAGGEVVAGALMMVQSLPFKLGAIVVSKSGPFLKDSSRPDAEAVYAASIEALVEEYDHKRHLMISVLPRASCGATNTEFAHLNALGFRAGAQLKFPKRYMVNLRLSDEDQRKSFSQKWRYHLNKSMKAELEFERADADQLLEFDALYQAMTDRKNFADYSAYDDTIKPLMEMEDKRLRPELFFVRHQGEIIAGALIFKAGETAVYLYGATNDQALPLRAGYFLHWQIIRWLRDNTEANWYDLGGSDGFQGLHQFKKGMVGDLGIIAEVPPMANFSSHFRSFIAGSLAFAARDALAATKWHIRRLRSKQARPDQQR